MKIDKSKIRTPDEEYEYLRNRLNNLGNFFSWEVHPNVIRADEIQRKKLQKRLTELVDSAEFQEYNPWNAYYKAMIPPQ